MPIRQELLVTPLLQLVMTMMTLYGCLSTSSAELQTISSSSTITVERCYGKPISFVCSPDHLLLLISATYRQTEECSNGRPIGMNCSWEESSSPSCIGQSSCSFVAPWRYLSTECGYSNSFLIRYQCVPADRQSVICKVPTVVDRQGYIITSNYPHSYEEGGLATSSPVRHIQDKSSSDSAPHGSADLVKASSSAHAQNCSMTLATLPGYRIELHAIDLQLAHTVDPETGIVQCIDSLSITDGFSRSDIVCVGGDRKSPLFVSAANQVTIHLTKTQTGSSMMIPHKGFWLYHDSIVVNKTSESQTKSTAKLKSSQLPESNSKKSSIPRLLATSTEMFTVTPTMDDLLPHQPQQADDSQSRFEEDFNEEKTLDLDLLEVHDNSSSSDLSNFVPTIVEYKTPNANETARTSNQTSGFEGSQSFTVRTTAIGFGFMHLHLIGDNDDHPELVIDEGTARVGVGVTSKLSTAALGIENVTTVTSNLAPAQQIALGLTMKEFGVVIGGSFCLIALCAALLVAAYFFFRRRKGRERHNPSLPHKNYANVILAFGSDVPGMIQANESSGLHNAAGDGNLCGSPVISAAASGNVNSNNWEEQQHFSLPEWMDRGPGLSTIDERLEDLYTEVNQMPPTTVDSAQTKGNVCSIKSHLQSKIVDYKLSQRQVKSTSEGEVKPIRRTESFPAPAVSHSNKQSTVVPSVSQQEPGAAQTLQNSSLRIYERLETIRQRDLPLSSGLVAGGSMRSSMGSSGRMESGLFAVGRHISELSAKRPSSDLYEANLLDDEDTTH